MQNQAFTPGRDSKARSRDCLFQYSDSLTTQFTTIRIPGIYETCISIFLAYTLYTIRLLVIIYYLVYTIYSYATTSLKEPISNASIALIKELAFLFQTL